MNVGQLRAELEGLSDDMIVVISKDAEGNHFSPLTESGQSMYLPTTTWFGDTYPTPEQIANSAFGYTEEDEAPEDSVRALVLWPVN